MKIWNKSFVVFLIINTAIFLSFNMATAGFPAFVSSYESSRLTTGLVTSVSAVAALAMRPIAGYVLDRRKGILFPVIGLLCMASPLLCLFSSNTATILIVRFLQGAGWGIASTVCSKSIANALPQERLSEGIGYAGFLSSVATAFAPGIAVSIGEQFGFSSMFRFIGICPVIAAMIFMTGVQNRKEEADLGRENALLFTFLSKSALVPAILIMTITMAYAPMVTFITPYAKSVGIAGTAKFFFAYACATIIARPLTGFYVDRKNAYAPTFIALLSMAAASVLLALCHDPVRLTFAGIFSGIGTGAGMNALQTLSVKKVAGPQRGVAMATFLFGFDLGMAAGSYLAGILSGSIGFALMFMIMSIPPLISCAAFTVMAARSKTAVRMSEGGQ